MDLTHTMCNLYHNIQVAVPLRPPLKLHTACIANGSLGISLLSAATTSVSRVVPHKPITTMQVHVCDNAFNIILSLSSFHHSFFHHHHHHPTQPFLIMLHHAGDDT